MNYNFIYLNKVYKVIIKDRRDDFDIVINDDEHNITNIDISDNYLTFCLRGKDYKFYFVTEKNKVYLSDGDQTFTIEESKATTFRDQTMVEEKSNSVSSPMPGLIVKIPVKIGDRVEKGDVLVIVEAMKMQNELCAPRRGIVKSINFDEGIQIDALRPIVELE